MNLPSIRNITTGVNLSDLGFRRRRGNQKVSYGRLTRTTCECVSKFVFMLHYQFQLESYYSYD